MKIKQISNDMIMMKWQIIIMITMMKSSQVINKNTKKLRRYWIKDIMIKVQNKKKNNKQQEMWELDRLKASGIFNIVNNFDFREESENNVNLLVHDIKPGFLAKF